MDPVTMVVAALAAGAGAGVKDTATAAVKDAYAGLKGLLAERFRDKPGAELALREHESSPQTWEAPLTSFVREVGVDEQMLALARLLLETTGGAGASYTVDADTVQGLLQGEKNVQHNTFGG